MRWLLLFVSLCAAAEARPFPSGEGRLRNRAQNMCLDVAGWNAQGDGNVLLWECNGDPDQLWSFSPTGELHNRAADICLDAAGRDGARGANVDIYRCESQDDQRWFLVPRGDAFELHNQKRGLCLDVAGRAGARGDNVLLWDCDGGADQTWTWEPIGGPHHHELVYEQPVPQPALEPMPPPAFHALLQAVRREGFSANKLQVIEQAASNNYFLAAQVKVLVESLSFSADKLRAAELTAPRLIDAQNAYILDGAFAFSEDKQKLAAILAHHHHQTPPPPVVVVPPPPRLSDGGSCSSAADCMIYCPSVPGCCGWQCGCTNAIRRDQRESFQAEYQRTCRRTARCPAVACEYRQAVADCVAGRCVAVTSGSIVR